MVATQKIQDGVIHQPGHLPLPGLCPPAPRIS
jgi:hypothetical protein